MQCYDFQALVHCTACQNCLSIKESNLLVRFDPGSYRRKSKVKTLGYASGCSKKKKRIMNKMWTSIFLINLNFIVKSNIIYKLIIHRIIIKSSIKFFWMPVFDYTFCFLFKNLFRLPACVLRNSRRHNKDNV